MTLETERIVLRKFRKSDAEMLYQYASDPKIGPAAGWQPHSSVEESLGVIKNVLTNPNTYAVTIKGEDTAIGGIGLKVGDRSNLGIPSTEAEVGYWLAVPFWGQGLIPEACRELIRHGFEDLKLDAIWCGYYDGNEKSKRVSEKCGFVYNSTRENVERPLMGDTKTLHILRLTKEKWESDRK